MTSWSRDELTGSLCFAACILLAYCGKVPNNLLMFDTGTANNRRLISINRIVSASGDYVV